MIRVRMGRLCCEYILVWIYSVHVYILIELVCTHVSFNWLIFSYFHTHSGDDDDDDDEGEALIKKRANTKAKAVLDDDDDE